MIEVDIKTSDAATVAFIPMRGPYSQIPEAMGRLYGWLAQHGLKPVGMPSGVYLTDPAAGEDDAAWEVRTPVAGDPADAAPDEAGVGIKRLTPCLVAVTMYRGPYEEVGPAYDEMAAWISGNGYRVAGPPEEFYMSDPSTPPQDIMTEIRFPIAKA